MCQVEIIFIRKMGAGMGPARRGRELCGKDLCEDDIEAATGGEKGTKMQIQGEEFAGRGSVNSKSL